MSGGPAIALPTGAARRVGLLCLAITILGWGLNWPIVKWVLADWPPLFARGVSGVIAGLALATIALARGERVAVPRAHWRQLCLAAFTNVFVWMGFSTQAMVWLRVNEAALLVYSMPIWAMLLAWPMRGERPGARHAIGLAIGLSGIAVLLLGGGLQLGAGRLPGIALALAAALIFAWGTIRPNAPIPLSPLSMTAWQVGLGCAPMLVAGLSFESPVWSDLSTRGFWGMTYMTLIPMGACYLCWFAAIRRLPSSVATSSTLMVPLVGVLSASVLLGEALGARDITAVALVLGGVALVLRR